MTPDAHAISLIDKEIMLSYLGTSIGIRTLTDGISTETIAFVAGVPMPYSVCAALLMFRLYGFDLNPPENALKDGMRAMWGKVVLPESIRTLIAQEHPLRLGRIFAERVITTHLLDPNPHARRDNLITFIDDLEARYAESLAEPVMVGSLAGLMQEDTEAKTVFDVARDIYQSITSFARA